MRKYIIFPLFVWSLYTNITHIGGNNTKNSPNQHNTNTVHEYTIIIDKCVMDEVSIDEPKVRQLIETLNDSNNVEYFEDECHDIIIKSKDTVAMINSSRRTATIETI